MDTHWQEHKLRLRNYITKHMGNGTFTDDILQEVYTKAFTKQNQLKSENSIGGWFFRIAHNAIMDHYRQQKPMDELSEDIKAPEKDEAELAHQELARCLRPLMAELPEKYAVPLEMAELEGMSQQQVADNLGLSLSGAKSRIQRARSQLKDRFTACCDIEVGRGGVTNFVPKGKNRNAE